jgi:ferredoxin
MPKYRIEIDRETCTGCELCTSEAPGTFAMDDEGLATVVDPAGDPPETILAAAQACPSESILLHDGETGEKIWPEE